VTPTDGAGAVPAGGGSSLPLPGGPGIDPAGITTGARGASLKRDAKAKVTPSHCIARSAAWIELRRFGAAVRTAVGRRKASAPRSARAASDDAAHSFAPFGALPPLIFWRQKDGGFGRQNPVAECVAGTQLLSAPAVAGEERNGHIFSKRLALPLRIFALSSSDSGTVCIQSSAGGFMTNGQSTANRI
jgi:hypothetical protein